MPASTGIEPKIGLQLQPSSEPESFSAQPRLREAGLPAAVVSSDDALTLDRLPAHRRAVILSLKDEFAYLYLLRLGLVVGAEVELVRSVSRGSIRIFRVDSGELALRSEAAGGITVRLLTREEQAGFSE